VRGKNYFAAQDTAPYTYYHLATEDYLTVREIADLVVEEMGLKNVEYKFSGGNRGWKGDVPIVRFDLAKVRSAGWRAERSAKEAMRSAVRDMIEETA
jgi:UDP-glucose 4-epimerase